MAGGGPAERTRTSAAPVGVTSSPDPSGPGLVLSPSSSFSVAGAGTGSAPCAASTVPSPVRSTPQRTSSTPSSDSPQMAPTTSRMASTAPTSLRWIFSIGTPWMAAAAGMEGPHPRGGGNAFLACGLPENADPTTALGSGVDSRCATEPNGIGAKDVFSPGRRAAATLVQRAQNESIAERARNAQPTRVRLRILPRRGAVRMRLECANHGCATAGLRHDHARESDIRRQPSAVAHLGEDLPHSDEPCAAAGGIDDVRRQHPSELLGDLDAHRLLALDTIRLTQRGYVEVSALRRERSRLLARVTDLAIDEAEFRAECADRCEDWRGSRARCVDPDRDSPGRSVCGERRTRGARPGDDESPYTERRGACDGGAHAACLEGCRGGQPFVLYPEPGNSDLSRQLGLLPHRRRSFAERHWHFTLREWQSGCIPPHVPARKDGVARRPRRIVADEKRLAARRADGRQRRSRLCVIACGAVEVPGAHVMVSIFVARIPGARASGGRSASGMRCALFSEKPGTAGSVSGVASRMACTLPKVCSSARRRLSPTPGMRRSSDVMVRTVRLFRWNVIAKRCASSRACWSIRSAGERRGSRSDSLLPSRKISSSRLARLASGMAPSPSASSASAAALNCPLPRSMSTRSGRARSSSSRLRK